MRSIPLALILGFMCVSVASTGTLNRRVGEGSAAGEYILRDGILMEGDTVKVESGTSMMEIDTPLVKKDSLVIISSQPGLSTEPGFRVQIFSSRNLSEAYQVQIKADSLLPGFNVYLIYDPPYYKVRVGDFRARYEANQAAALILLHGFPNAWAVPDNIFKNPSKKK